MTRLFDHHIHTDCRNADDYELMAVSGVTKILVPCSATNELRFTGPGFGAHFDRLTGFERERARRYGVEMLVGLAVNAADIGDPAGAFAALDELSACLREPCVRAVGELSLRRFTADEVEIFERQLEIATAAGLPVLVEGPPELAAFERLLAVLESALDRGKADRRRVGLTDVNQHKLKLARRLRLGGYGLPVSPKVDGLFGLREKLTHLDVLEILAEFGPDGLMLNTGLHCGSGDPLGLAKTVLRLRLSGVDEPTLRNLACDHAEHFFGC